MSMFVWTTTGARARLSGTVRLWALLSLAALVLAACSSAPAVEPAGDDAAAVEDDDPFADVSRLAPALLSFEVEGDVAFTWEQEADLRIVTLAPVGGREGHLFSVGLEDMQELTTHEHFRFAFDITGGYDGAGTYIVHAQGGTDEDVDDTMPTGVISAAFLVFARVIDVDADPIYTLDNLEFVREYNVPLENCIVEVTDGEATGSLTCPNLADHEGNTISLVVTWQLVEA